MSGVDSLGFTYSLDVARLTGPAADAARALGLLNSGLGSVARSLAKLESGASGAGIGRIAKATEHAAAASSHWERSSRRSFDAQTDGWSKSQAAAEKANHSLGKMQAAAIAMDQRRTAAAAREIERRGEASDREMKRELRNASRISAAREKAAGRAAEKASHKYYYGGETSFGGLYQKQHDSQISGLASGIAGSLTPLSMAGLVVGGASAAFGLVTDVVSAGASLAFQFGKMAISSQAMRENSVAAFTSIYGSAEVGNKLFDDARRMGQLTKFETKDVVGIYNTLAANNFTAGELPKYSWAVADIASMRDPEHGQMFLTALAKIRSSKAADFGTLQSAGLAGPGKENVFTELGKITGDGEMSKIEWQKKLRGGSVTREQGLQAVMQAVIGKYDKKTGKIGDAAREQGQGTWEGLISNIGEGLGNTLSRKSITDLPELQQFKGLLGSIGELFDENSVRGQKFGALMSRFVADVFIPFGGLEGKSDNILDKLLEGGGRIEKWFNGVMTDIRKGIKEAFSDDGAGIAQLAAKVGFAIGGGILKGVLSELPGSRYSVTVQGSEEQAWANVQADASSSLIAPGSILGDAYDFLGGSRSPPGGSHASGGEIPGPYGMPVLTLMHGGEIVPGLHGERMGDAQRAYGGGGGTVHNHTWYVQASGIDDFESQATRIFEGMVRSPSASSTPG